MRLGVGKYIEAAVQVLKASKKPLNYREITKLAINKGLLTPGGKTPEDSMGAQISMNMKQKGLDSAFMRVSPGIYKLNPKHTTADKPNPTTQSNILEPKKRSNIFETKKVRYVGTGGEYLVAGRLLLNGYNASMFSVDEGVDVVAIKDDKMYGIQVKTANKSASGYVADINVNSYGRNSSGSTFYVFVLLGDDEKYVVLPYQKMQELIDAELIKTIHDGKKYRATFTKQGDRVFLGRSKYDVTYNVGRWDLIV